MRTTLWVVPVLEVAAVSVLFVITHAIDRAAYRKTIELRDWVNNGSADAARQVLTGIAGTVITVVGLVFSITILALTVAATQFGPRMMRNFIRDTGTQVTLGTFVATFVYAILAPGSVSGGNVEFVPHLSVTVLLGMVLVDVGVLVYFIHRVAKWIQLTEVVACIARWLTSSIENEKADASAEHSDIGGLERETLWRLANEGVDVPAPESGYLQFISYPTLVRIVSKSDAVIELLQRRVTSSPKAFRSPGCGPLPPRRRSRQPSTTPTSQAPTAP